MEKIQYYKWNLKDFKKLKKSCQKYLDVKNYVDLSTIFFHFIFHNVQYKKIEFRNWFKKRSLVKEMLSIEKDKYYTSNIFLNVILKNIKDNTEYNERASFVNVFQF